MKKIIFFTLLTIAALLSSLSLVYADIIVIPPEGTALPIANDITNIDGAGDVIGKIIAWMIRITAIFSIIAITWGSIQMILAAGEEEKVKKARYIIIYAFIGLCIAGVAYGVVSFVTTLQLNSFIR